MARVPVECPRCSARGAIDDRYAGTQISCPKCGGTFILSESTPTTSDVGAADLIDEALRKLREARDHRVEEQAIDSLVTLGVPALPRVIELLEDPTRRCEAAARALGRMGGTEAVAALLRQLKDPGGLRLSAAIALGETGDQGAIEPLAQVLRDPPDYKRNRYLRPAAAEAIGRIRGRSAAQSLAGALQDDDGAVRKAAAEGLGLCGDSESVTYLARAIRDRDGLVQCAAVTALGRIGGPQAREVLIAALADVNPLTILDVAEALARLGDTGTIVPVVTAALARGVHLHPHLIPKLKDMGVPNDPTGRAWYYVGIGDWPNAMLSGSAAVEPLVRALASGTLSARRSAAGALVTLYRSGKLDKAHKWMILAAKKTMAQPHTDGSVGSDCGSHTDTGIGVEL